MSTLTGGQGNIITNGLVLRLDAANPRSYQSGSLIWNDLSGNNSGSLVNGPAFTGSNGGSIVFDGVDDYVSVSKQSALVNASQFTLMSWMKRRTVSSKVVCHQGATLNEDISFELWSDGFAYFEVGNANNSYANIANTSINWQYLAMVFDGTQTGNSNRLKCYIDGSLLNVAYNGTIPATTADPDSIFSVGATIGTGYSNFSDGNIAQVLIYNRSLNQSEITQNFNATRARFGI